MLQRVINNDGYYKINWRGIVIFCVNILMDYMAPTRYIWLIDSNFMYGFCLNFATFSIKNE